MFFKEGLTLVKAMKAQRGSSTGIGLLFLEPRHLMDVGG